MAWKDQSIKRKLFFGFGVGTLATIAVGIIGIVGIRSVNESMKGIITVEVPIVEMANEMKTTLMASRKTLEEYMTAADISTGDDADSLEVIIAAYEDTISDFDLYVNAALDGGIVDDTNIISIENNEIRALLNEADMYHNSKFQSAASDMIEAIENVLVSRHSSWNKMQEMEAVFSEVYSDLEKLESDFDDRMSGIIQRASSAGELRRIINEDLPLIDLIVELKVSLAESRIVLEEYMQLNDSHELEQLRYEYNQTIQSFDTYVHAILNGGVITGNRIYATSDEYMIASITEIDGDHSEFQVMAEQLFEARNNELLQSQLAMNAMLSLDLIGDETAQLITQFEDLAGTEMENAKIQSERSAVMITQLAIAVTLVALALSILIGVLITRGITIPLGKCVSLAASISEGDLTSKLDIDQKDEIGQLANSLQEMQNQIITIVTDIRDSAGNVSSGSQQLSSSAQQISQGTTEQAASGEEVSSSMEEMSSNIEQTADYANETERIADESTEMVSSGGQIVNETVDAMKVIAEKIAVVEDIAKQTNLLALNAAIEAARAGEQGKGFAVVASEVRKLAENSQKAALDIRELSVSSVSIAQKAGKIFTDIIPATQKTSDLVKEINSSSKEQKIGTEQITKAISQLDLVIQQNASAAEEMATMAEELAGQAVSLTKTISYFRTENLEETQLLTDPTLQIEEHISSEHARA